MDLYLYYFGPILYMTRGRVLLLAATALLLETLPLVVAHGEEHDEVGMDMKDAPQPPVQDGGAPTSYWSLSEHAGLMYMHILTEIIAWVVVLPVGEPNIFSNTSLKRSTDTL